MDVNQTSRTTSPFKSKEERIIPPKIVIKTLTAVDVVSLNIAHLKLLGQQTLTKLWHGCEMLKNRHANDARNNNNENEHNTQQQQHTYPKRNGRFGLLQDNEKLLFLLLSWSIIHSKLLTTT